MHGLLFSFLLFCVWLLAIKPSYPSSAKKHVDWGKLEKDIEKDTKDDDADVNSLFSKIYNSGDENTKKAMMKSMVMLRLRSYAIF